MHSVVDRTQQQGGGFMGTSRRLFALGWLAVLVGGLLAYWIQTAGAVRIQDVRFTGVNGRPMSGLLRSKFQL